MDVGRGITPMNVLHEALGIGRSDEPGKRTSTLPRTNGHPYVRQIER